MDSGMGKNVTQKLIANHLVDGRMQPGEEIGIKIDQTLTQDATGTMVMLEFEAMQIPRVKTELSAQYVDHNLLQTDFKNADDHLFLLSACKKFGVWYSRPGNGVSHPVHMERFGIPGRTLLGSDSHTPAAGALGMLAMTFFNSADYDRIEQGDVLEITDVCHILRRGNRISVTNKTKKETYHTQHTLSERQIEMILEGSLINVVRKRQQQT
jgi:homoaconitase/3-isopropylmalate dehydratase large subunit